MFRMIGNYEMTRDGDVIRVVSASEFNLEAAQQYARDMLAMMATMSAKFGTLVEFESPPIIGPEVEEAMHCSAMDRGQRGMVAVAFAIRDVEALTVASRQWHRIYEGTGIAFAHFRDAAPARAWLQAQVDGRRRG
jgi:hypothetical protein